MSQTKGTAEIYFRDGINLESVEEVEADYVIEDNDTITFYNVENSEQELYDALKKSVVVIYGAPDNQLQRVAYDIGELPETAKAIETFQDCIAKGGKK